MSRNLLMDDRPLVVLPGLAKLLGSVDDAIVLQQIHWLLQQPHNGVVVDGHKWIWGTYEEWIELYFPMWNVKRLKRITARLEQKGVLVADQLMKQKWDRTKYYRIDYDVFEKMKGNESRNGPIDGDKLSPSGGTNCPGHNIDTETSTKRERSLSENGAVQDSGANSLPLVLEDPPGGPKKRPKRRGRVTGRNIDPRKLVDGYIPPGAGDTPYEVYREVFNYTPSKPQIRAIMDNVTDLELWRKILNAWALRGYRSNNIGGMLDWYNNRGPTDANAGRNGKGPAAPVMEPSAFSDPFAK